MKMCERHGQLCVAFRKDFVFERCHFVCHRIELLFSAMPSTMRGSISPLCRGIGATSWWRGRAYNASRWRPLLVWAMHRHPTVGFLVYVCESVCAHAAVSNPPFSLPDLTRRRHFTTKSTLQIVTKNHLYDRWQSHCINARCSWGGGCVVQHAKRPLLR
jgi:hypothetical protein